MRRALPPELVLESEASLRLADSLLEEFRDDAVALVPGLFQKLIPPAEADPVEAAARVYCELDHLLEVMRRGRARIERRPTDPHVVAETLALLHDLEVRLATLLRSVERVATPLEPSTT